jgi:integrase
MASPTLRPPHHEALDVDEVRPPARADEFARLGERVRDFVAASKAPNTIRSYTADWADFAAWCDLHGLDPLPAAPATVAAYLTHRASTDAVSTLAGRTTSISVRHKMSGHESPTQTELVRSTMRGIRRTFGVSVNKKQALVLDDVRAMVAELGDGLGDVRDRALVLVAFASAMRRGELAALDVGDVAVTGNGLEVTIRRSKTDQQGEGVTIGLPYASNPANCPVRAYQAWLDAAAIADGPIFRQVDRHGNVGGRMSGRAVAERIKRLAERVGHDPRVIGGHSTRRGFITTAARAKVLERDIMRHSRHKSVAIMRGYIEEADVWADNAAVAIGL